MTVQVCSDHDCACAEVPIKLRCAKCPLAAHGARQAAVSEPVAWRSSLKYSPDVGEWYEYYDQTRTTNDYTDLQPLYTNPPAAAVSEPQLQSDLLDRLVAISSAVADSDDRAAQSMLREAIKLLAAPPAAAKEVQAQPVARMPLKEPCKGKNCGSMDGWFHSVECHAEHAAAVGAAIPDHIDAMRQALEALKANHQWHKDYDDHDGYPGSDLEVQNMEAITKINALGIKEQG